MSFRALAWVDIAYLGEPGARTCGIGATLNALAQYADEDNKCWPRQSTIASRSRQSERTVRSNLDWLEENGFLKRERRSSVEGRLTDIITLMVGKFPMGTISDPLQPANSAGCATGKKCENVEQILPVAVIHETVIETVTARAEAAPKQRKQRPQFQEPTLEEWKSFCREKWPWMPDSHAEQSWNHYHLGAVDGQWVQKDGTPIRAWRQCANTSHGLFMASNPDAKSRYLRTQQTAQRPSQGAQATPKTSFLKSPEWLAHVEKCKAQGMSMQQTMLSFSTGEGE